MDLAYRGGGSRAALSPPPCEPSQESLSHFAEGVSIVLSQWAALQMAVEKEWGGRDSPRKYEELASTIICWFSQPKVRHCIDDLEHMLDENMVLSFNTEIEDGSIEEVAEQLMIMHEDCILGHYISIEKLRRSNPAQNTISHCRWVVAVEVTLLPAVVANKLWLFGIDGFNGFSLYILVGMTTNSAKITGKEVVHRS